jgi:hypothetical protein
MSNVVRLAAAVAALSVAHFAVAADLSHKDDELHRTLDGK